MSQAIPRELAELWSRFEDPEHNPGGWSHQAVVQVAVAAVMRNGDLALPEIRSKLQALNAANRILSRSGAEDGYHETLTRIWLELIKQALQAEGGELDSAGLDRITARLSDSRLPKRFYSKALLDSEQAKRQWIEPDLADIQLHPPLLPLLSQLWMKFRRQDIAHEDWVHKTHLQVAIAARIQHGPQAIDLMREGIQRLNAKHGIAQTPEGGYHETLTCVWCKLVELATPEVVDEERLEQILMRLTDKNLPLQYYSRERMLSWEARTTWLEPDLAALS